MFNYNKRDLELIAAQTGFIRDNLEKVFRLSDVLAYIADNKILFDNLVLKGGTAINLTVFDLPRLSVDIDLDFATICERSEMLQIRETINSNLLNFMFAHGYALSPNTKNPHSLDSWVFYFQNAAGNRDNIRVEINYSLRNHILPIEQKKMSTSLLSAGYRINTLAIPELCGTKIKALIERTAPRDIYDVHNIINSGIIVPEQYNLLRKIVVFYLAVGSTNSMVWPPNYDAIKELKYHHIRASLAPVLRKPEQFDFKAAGDIVYKFVTNLMQITDNELEFIDQFRQKSYRPDLLFEDSAIMERIREHPMAKWKTRR